MRGRIGLVSLAALALSVSIFTSIAADAKPQARASRKPAPASRPGTVQQAPKSAAPAPVDVSPAFNAYLGRLRGRVLNKWFLPDGQNHVVITASVAQDGSVSSINIASTPNNPAAEQAASDAFNQCQPLEALPSNTPGATLTVTFDSTADPHGDSKSNVTTKMDPINLKPADSAPISTPTPPSTSE